MRRKALALLIAAASAALAGQATAAAPQPRKSIEISRFLGRWYEIARTPNVNQKDCFAATKVQYLYKAKGAAGLKYLARPDATPADAEMVTTLSGATVPFVVRVETGVINRAIYQFAVLHNPATDGPIGPRTSPKGWAKRLIAVHGTGCARGWYIQGAAMGVSPIEPK